MPDRQHEIPIAIDRNVTSSAKQYRASNVHRYIQTTYLIINRQSCYAISTFLVVLSDTR